MALSFIELNKKNLVHNLKLFRGIAKRGTQFALAIKGNAYGHGQNEIAKIAEPYADYFLLNSIEELRLLRKVSKKPVLLLGPVDSNELREAIRLNATFSAFSVTTLKALNRASDLERKIPDVHLACDAYLGREGFLLSELSQALEYAKTLQHIRIVGVYAHFANIEDTINFGHAEKQIQEYKKMVALVHASGYKNIVTHISATSGLLAYERSTGIHPLIRLGIGLYGLWPSIALQRAWERKGMYLKPVLSWKSHVALVKRLPKGSTIGYGLTYKTKFSQTVALVPQGYADGLPRTESNNGFVLIRGVRCKILGRVSMNMITVDAESVPGVTEGDPVVIIGKQGSEEITAEEVAKEQGTINYEAVTRISALLPRSIV
jgi:alanine racemase